MGTTLLWHNSRSGIIVVLHCCQSQVLTIGTKLDVVQSKNVESSSKKTDPVLLEVGIHKGFGVGH
jgi:hypothetical protein